LSCMRGPVEHITMFLAGTRSTRRGSRGR
jgi:hypothetical protein